VTTFKERRRFPRVARGLSLKLSSDACDLIAETENISAAGANCLVTEAMPMMTRVAVMILLPIQRAGKPSTRQIRCEGVVVRSEAIRTSQAPNSRYATAIYFSNIKVTDQRAINAYVKQQLAETQRTLESL
jgi:hypothetical protein